ncbi:MAG: alpha/beta hydrolase [Ideonella sp.]|nr:alpha/beta hydrolase [Ideonella sp.]MCC7455868.1 lysophospholipase [Nitrospira sp.]
MHALHTHDDLPLHLRQWTLKTRTHGLVLIVHGLGEHIGRYEHVAAALNDAGWDVAGYDHRGHGASGGARGAIARADSLLDDLGVVIDTLRREPARPLVLLGHSLGGLIAARFVAEGLVQRPAAWWRPVDALVLSSPALDPGMNAVQRALLAVLGPLAPQLAVGNGLKPQWVSRDPAVVRAYIDDPLVHDRVTPLLVRFVVDAGAFVRTQAPQWRVPTLLLWAGADRCVAPAGSAAFAAAAPATALAHTCYPQMAHEIFNDPERAAPLAELTRWLGSLETLRRPHTALESSR